MGRNPLSLWALIDQSGGPDACWPWTGTTNEDGYGRKGDARAHRLVLEEHLGHPLGSLFALHRCDNPSCCNPAHLYAGTNADNMLDMVARGRAPIRMRPRTHCKRGHELTPENVKRERQGQERRCRTCIRAQRVTPRARAVRAAYERLRRARIADHMVGPQLGRPETNSRLARPTAQ